MCVIVCFGELKTPNASSTFIPRLFPARLCRTLRRAEIIERLRRLRKGGRIRRRGRPRDGRRSWVVGVVEREEKCG